MTASGAKPMGAFPVTPILTGPVPEFVASNPPPQEIVLRTTFLATGLRGPDGFAVDPETSDVYVAMEDSAAIVRVKPDGSKHVLFDSDTPVYEEGPERGSRKRAAGLRSPEGLALDPSGILYVVEDVPGGRLLAFKPKERTWRPSGKVVPLPIENSRFAWESVAVGPAGELLLAGSTLESFLNESAKDGVLGLFWGAVLYRDAQGEWWLPLHSPLVSYSAADFAPDGGHAFFAAEVPGLVGCLDLRSRKLNTYHATTTLQAPEGLCALPDGTALVAEEGGKIYRLSPFADTVQLVHDVQHSIETLHWNARQRRVLVTDDQRGCLLALEIKPAVDFQTPPGVEQAIPFTKQFLAVDMIPDECPGYLARILKLGGYDPLRAEVEVSFRDFARKYSLVAIDANVNLISHATPVEDPIARIQFVIVAPYMIGMMADELIWSSSGFAAVKESGHVVKTELVSRAVIQGDLMECRFTPVGGQQIALPMPFSTKVDPDGVASVHFMGMGVMPDYLVMLNTLEPNSSFMLVMPPNERPQLYAVNLPPSRDRRYWVIALDRKEPEMWKPLSFPSEGSR